MNNRLLAAPLGMSTRITAGKDVIFAELGEEISLLSIQSGFYYMLNAVAASVWRQINQPTSLTEIKIHLLEEFNVEESRCERDLMRIVEDLHSHGLIEVPSS